MKTHTHTYTTHTFIFYFYPIHSHTYQISNKNQWLYVDTPMIIITGQKTNISLLTNGKAWEVNKTKPLKGQSRCRIR